MARKIASETERRRRIQSGYLASGRKSIRNTEKTFGGTRTQEIAAGDRSRKAKAAKHALNKGMHRTKSQRRVAGGVHVDSMNMRGGYKDSGRLHPDSRFAGTRTERFGIREAARNASKGQRYKRMIAPAPATYPATPPPKDTKNPRGFAKQTKESMKDRLEQERAGGVRRGR